MAAKNNQIKNKVIQFYELLIPAYKVKRMLLFGSYAKGNPHKDSDIDVGVVIESKKGMDKMKIGAALFHFARKVDINIEPYCIFWDEYKNCDKASILAEIKRTSLIIV